jgi:hypothetical protein
MKNASLKCVRLRQGLVGEIEISEREEGDGPIP